MLFAVGPTGLPRRCEVIVRTARGVEVARVLRRTHQPIELSVGRDEPAPQTHSAEQADAAERAGVVNPGAAVGSDGANWTAASPVEILRRLTPEDRWLIDQLRRHRDRAVRHCQRALADAGFNGCLLDVDQQFDGGRLILHFLGPADVGREITDPIIRQYESIVRSTRLAERLTRGCGPNCGTSDSDCKGSCAGCAVADSCGVAGAVS